VTLPQQQSARQARLGWSRHQSISAKHHHEDSDSKQEANNKPKTKQKVPSDTEFRRFLTKWSQTNKTLNRADRFNGEAAA